MSTVTIIGSFGGDGECAQAIEALREAKFANLRAFSPFPSHRIAHAIGKPKSRTRWGALAGGIAGVLTGLALTIGTSYEWSLDTGGKPIISWPPFIVICFELMILLGGISGFLGFLFMSGVPALEPAAGYESSFSGDRFGVAVHCEDADQTRVESILTQAGAEIGGKDGR
ncbi:MAG: DUF3341 domain-containing protein [Candidatus Binataceae bacterium]